MSEYKDEGIMFINRSDFVMVYEATARVGIDVKKVKVDVNNLLKTVTVTIPKAEVLDVKVDMDSIKYFDTKFALLNVDYKEDANKATSIAEKNQSSCFESHIARTRFPSNICILLPIVLKVVLSFPNKIMSSVCYRGSNPGRPTHLCTVMSAPDRNRNRPRRAIWFQDGPIQTFF